MKKRKKRKPRMVSAESIIRRLVKKGMAEHTAKAIVACGAK